jgi:hypothetical protein
VSHSRERKEKTCLSCGASLYGRYCHECGQENIEPKQSAWHLVTHFFYDITHFDGKFFLTLKDLVAKPGFLSREYMAGRRSSYLNPVRMYVFTSAIFFIIFFALINPNKFQFRDAKAKSSDITLNLNDGMQAALKKAGSREDSAAVKEAFRKLKQIPFGIKDSVTRKENQGLKTDFTIDPAYDFDSQQQYDSIQHSLKPEKRDGWFKTAFTHKLIGLKTKYKEDSEGFFKELINTFLHNLPKLLFISLPLFALLLKLLYVRHKQYYYVDHGIFAIHVYIYSFIALLFFFGLSYVQGITGFAYMGLLKALLGIFSFYYFYKAMRVFYAQGRAKTLVKYFLVNVLSFIMLIALFSIFISFSALEI